MMYISGIYYGICIFSSIYFIIYLGSIIRKFSKILNIKIFSIKHKTEIKTDEIEIKIESNEEIPKIDHNTSRDNLIEEVIKNKINNS